MQSGNFHNVYFIGIGGIGMSALARYFKKTGRNVMGYDKTPTHLTDELRADGITVHFEDDVKAIPAAFRPEDTLVVVTPAVPKDHGEWNYFLANGYTVKKRAEVLGIVTRDSYCLAVAGTHGKTTTSSILAHILYTAKADMTAFLGGIVENYDSNIVGDGTALTVVEADEFDRSFLHLHPDVACITSMDADHLDIYGDDAAIKASFTEFAAKVTDKSKLFIANGLPLDGVTVAVGEKADVSAQHVRIENGRYVFDIVTPTMRVTDVAFGLPGHHNLMNALMAAAMAMTAGVSADDIRTALDSFRGVRRRFSYQIREERLVYIDDYAHHPTEIDAVRQAVRELYPGKKILAVFQPHLYSRTRDFIDGFARSLSGFDEIVLLDIYPARELPIEGVTSNWLLEKIENPHKELVSKTALFEVLKTSDADVFVTIGAGDIGEMTADIKNVLHEKA